ncbi:glycogen/starch/alpha-glucan phosphorylase [Sporolactobacillus inulinus]|jgi:starch phosphorylase|uniref:Alpha-1,4 glucan phosphorylase n=1 Tax=Sporolactobacillus inulinus CASD TaxID=1069536 RepID=A0A0U1QLI4_9BACL|nr:glycogen/starch/alpha-glucan phosphorylase [Sporolactobacillus inulinus]KLI01675.1 glucan phosphorylase [Sporolactobacillus inulinus CASD]GEB76130.1 alpha-1,4 glucan phosphorylase [Sporolactobacillus inulinus]
MDLSKRKFKEDFKKMLTEVYSMGLKESEATEQFFTLGNLIRSYVAKNWSRTNQAYIEKGKKQVYYFSMEFLLGRMLKSNLLNLGILETVRDGLSDLGIDLEALVQIEPDPGLGNGGLGRLAACFIDSMATSEIPAHGNGIRYKYGLFKQKFVNGYQVELPENWLQNGNVWETRKMHAAVTVRFYGHVWLEHSGKGYLVPHYEDAQEVLAVPYDSAVIGFNNEIVNTLRLWSAEVPPQDESTDYWSFIHQRNEIESISEVLYPDDSNYEGRLLRLKQEYFFVSAGVQSIIRHYKKMHLGIEHLAEKVAIHINDTHPALCIPELMRILLDEEHMDWEHAWHLTINTMSYTNHTIMTEAMEKWPIEMIQTLLPRIVQIICEIDRRYVMEMGRLFDTDLIQSTRIVEGGHVRMAHMAIIGSHSINGVAQLHTNILKEKVLHPFYLIYPSKFNNKTNGITQRRWLMLANEPLRHLIDRKIGNEWATMPTELKMLKAFREDKRTLQELAEVKRQNKVRFARFVEESMGLEINPEAIFDVQIKRLHAYKRQLLNLLHILSLYFKLKEHPEADLHPRVFIFGAKAAPSYTYAKQIIKLINSVAELINHDPDIHDKLKLVFVENYGVSLAERIIPAADVSEQISLASKEASGTSNMKLMLNGAVTLATLDGANVEIREHVGEDNIVLFGLRTDEVYHYYKDGTYHAHDYYEKNQVLHRVLNALIDGTIPGAEAEGYAIFDSLVRYGDEYFVLRDFDDYAAAQERIDRLYRDSLIWQKMALINIASAGIFSSDYTVQQYASQIWDVSSKVHRI